MPQYTDEQRRSFLDALDAADDVYLRDWELQFIEGNMDKTWFSPKQRDCIDRMIHDHGDKIRGQW